MTETSFGTRNASHRWGLASVAFVLVLLPAGTAAWAHGSILVPLSRVMHCRFVDDPESPMGAACSAAVNAAGSPQFLYDWDGVRQGFANSMHQLVVPDGQLCGGGGSEFAALDLPRDDWIATSIEADPSGNFEFIYQASIKHPTEDMLFYITPEGWDPESPLTWADLDFVNDPLRPGVIDPFCAINSVSAEDYPGVSDQVYRMTCPLPVRSGRHVIYNVWQRSDGPEAFYACMDVVMTGNELFLRDGFETGQLDLWSIALFLRAH